MKKGLLYYISALAIQLLIIITSFCCIASCKTSKSVMKDIRTETKDTKDTLTTQVSSLVNNVTSEENKTVAASEKHNTNEVFSSTLLMLLNGDQQGSLKPDRAIFMQHTQVQKNDSIQEYRAECESLRNDISMLRASLQKYESMLQHQEATKQTTMRDNKLNICDILVIVFIIGLITAVIYIKRHLG